MLSNKNLITLSTLVVAIFFSSMSYADHAWGKYKWKISGSSLNLDLGNNVNSDWLGHLLIASTDWTVSSVVDTWIIDGSTDPIVCNPESGNVQVCNAAYGKTGWLGIAQIYGRGNSITAGVAKLNDTYFGMADYNTPAWRQLVMCQEVAHTFGLDHQDEDFNNPNLDTCMDYTSSPESNQHPNQHDYDQLEIIYGGGTSDGGGGGCNPRSPKCNPANTVIGREHAKWGQLMSKHGGAETYEKDLGGGHKVITFVTWALEHADDHEH